MRKLFTLAATLLVAGSAFAASPILNSGRLFVKPNATSNITLPATTNNNDSCDISVSPAATLLLPYFEVDATNTDTTTAVNTLFTITNTSSASEIAHVTVWTDWSFPVLDFNLFLTGYDVVGVSLYDILAANRSGIPVTGESKSHFGDDSDDSNVHFLTSEPTSCDSLPGPIPSALQAAVLSALTTGVYSGCAGLVGNVHTNAIGYITMDTVADCTQQLPTDFNYFDSTIIFDNVLIGDYQRIDPTHTSTATGFASGGPLVHIKAIPDDTDTNTIGGTLPSTFPFTFYDRYTQTNNTDNGTLANDEDRRQPLPSVFAARYIDSGSFGTSYAIWREGVTDDIDTCSTTADYKQNDTITFTQIVRFDESENPTLSMGGCQISPCPVNPTFSLPETSLTNVDDASGVFPASDGEDSGGWMYLNLSNPDTPGNYSNRGTAGNTVSQNWVTVRLTAEGRYGVDFDAAYLGNGCSPNPGPATQPGPLSSPLPDFNPCPVGVDTCNPFVPAPLKSSSTK